MQVELRPVGLQSLCLGTCPNLHKHIYIIDYNAINMMYISGMHAGGAEAGRSAEPMPGDLPQPYHPDCGWAQSASAGPQVSTAI